MAMISTWIAWRTNLLMLLMTLARSLALALRSMVTERKVAQREPSGSTMPMARTTSPLRSAASVKA